MLEKFLLIEEFDVRTAENGFQGIAVYHEFKPEICIVDIGLPDLNGFEVAMKIKECDYQPELLIALTGYGQAEDRKKVIEAGFDLHLVKPIEPTQLMKTIAQETIDSDSTKMVVKGSSVR